MAWIGGLPRKQRKQRGKNDWKGTVKAGKDLFRRRGESTYT
jgi:hypothetical protein